MEVVQLNKLTLKAYDMGGHASGRLLWSQYFPILDAIVFVVDAADPSRFDLASECLNVRWELFQMDVMFKGN
jgi:GTP-binding protein SAR1